ncbi:hypothetical protein ElyMa_001894200 [Elysia marginata]|uniref:Uncharacterized protein n=1 Tax=Elysia marginata TaxID=1093978 RepID=A0AAV4ERS8_9GAST|nr:hypothetical protein ElyMa_001894200 [Elysia marginata]
MDPVKFYGKHKRVFVRNVPDVSDDSELSDEDDPIDETWKPDDSSTSSDGDEPNASDVDEGTQPSTWQPNEQRQQPWRVRPHKTNLQVTEEPVFSGAKPPVGPPKQPIAYFRDIMDRVVTCS